MAESPLISVIVPVYNGERYLAEAIRSILDQSYRPLEIIVVDDGSTDESAAIVRSFGSSVRYELQSNAGAAAARNRGVELAHGTIISFLDADDLWTPEKLDRQMKALQAREENEAVFGMMQQFISPDVDHAMKAGLRCPDEPIPGYTQCTMLIRRGAFLRVGFFETSWDVGEFVAWYSKAIEKKLKSTMIPDVVLHRRLHAGNQGRHKRDSQTDYVRILKASLDRRRQNR